MKVQKVCAELVVRNLRAALGAIGGVALVLLGHSHGGRAFASCYTAKELQMIPSDIKFSVVCVALLLFFGKEFNALRLGLRRWINRL
jgi:hypothetical protein